MAEITLGELYTMYFAFEIHRSYWGPYLRRKLEYFVFINSTFWTSGSRHEIIRMGSDRTGFQFLLIIHRDVHTD